MTSILFYYILLGMGFTGRPPPSAPPSSNFAHTPVRPSAPATARPSPSSPGTPEPMVTPPKKVKASKKVPSKKKTPTKFEPPAVQPKVPPKMPIVLTNLALEPARAAAKRPFEPSVPPLHNKVPLLADDGNVWDNYQPIEEIDFAPTED